MPIRALYFDSSHSLLSDWQITRSWTFAWVCRHCYINTMVCIWHVIIFFRGLFCNILQHTYVLVLFSLLPMYKFTRNIYLCCRVIHFHSFFIFIRFQPFCKKEKDPSIRETQGFSSLGEFKTTICERFCSRDPQTHMISYRRGPGRCPRHLMFPAWRGVHANDIVFIKYCFNINKTDSSCIQNIFKLNKVSTSYY